MAVLYYIFFYAIYNRSPINFYFFTFLSLHFFALNYFEIYVRRDEKNASLYDTWRLTDMNKVECIHRVESC